MNTHPPVLEMRGISRSFPGVRALNEASLRLYPGEIHSLMGQNGAGKSTLIKVLTGVHAPDAGEIHLHGQAITPDGPLAAQQLGIATVYQEVNLCPNLSVAENIFIGRFPKPVGNARAWLPGIDWARLNDLARAELQKLNLDIDVTRALDTCPVAIQQMVAIARALSIDSRVLILDEPTSSLDENEVEQLFATLRDLKARGVAILFVTHFLDQVYAISDRITVMRNGECEGEYLPQDLPPLALISKMIGREFSAADQNTASPLNEQSQQEPCLSVLGLGRSGSMQSFDLQLRKGEVLGLSGLLGSGRTETARLLFGADRADSGEICLDAHTCVGRDKPGRAHGDKPFRSPREAIRQGIGYCPEDRKTEGIIADLSVRENIILALQSQRGWLRGIPLAQQRAIADNYIRILGIRTPDAEKPIGQLSGGNQQKAMLARWLATQPQILILDEPTRGIDVAAKQEIMDQVTALCADGMSILFISSELDETVRVSHRVAVLRDRNKVGELRGQDIDPQSILRMIAGAEA